MTGIFYMKNLVYNIINAAIYGFMLYLTIFASNISESIEFTYAAF